MGTRYVYLVMNVRDVIKVYSSAIKAYRTAKKLAEEIAEREDTEMVSHRFELVRKALKRPSASWGWYFANDNIRIVRKTIY